MKMFTRGMRRVFLRDEAYIADTERHRFVSDSRECCGTDAEGVWDEDAGEPMVASVFLFEVTERCVLEDIFKREQIERELAMAGFVKLKNSTMRCMFVSETGKWNKFERVVLDTAARLDASIERVVYIQLPAVGLLLKDVDIRAKYRF